MDNDFFVPRVPADAEYCTSHDFRKVYGKDSDRILEVVQVVDYRIGPEDIEKIELSAQRPEIERFFEVKDMQLTKRVGDILCGVSLYDSERRHYGKHKDFSLYFNGLKDLIEIFRTVRTNEKLRVYVADNVWERLHHEKILKSADVDFVRMAALSRNTDIGHLWRLLVFDDFEYPYASTSDLDTFSKTWRSPELICGNNLENFMTHINFSPGRYKESGCDLFFHHRHLRAIFPVAQYMRSCVISMIRSPIRFPFASLRQILCHLLDDSGVRILYNPEMNLWTNVHEGSYFYHSFDDFWLPLLSKILNIKFWIRKKRVQEALALSERYGKNVLCARLWRQLVKEGHTYEFPLIDSADIVKFEQSYGISAEVNS